jgi:methionyl-tRNA formyltransferase
VATGHHGHLILEEVQPAGKRWMSGTEFAAGYRPKVGETLD